jgi:hypothetical protein
MTELRCLIIANMLARDHFRPSSPLAKNGFFGEENCFLRAR